MKKKLVINHHNYPFLMQTLDAPVTSGSLAAMASWFVSLHENLFPSDAWHVLFARVDCLRGKSNLVALK